MMSVPDNTDLSSSQTATYILMGTEDHTYRRIFTDGRAWPADTSRPIRAFRSGNGSTERQRRFNVLEAETRGTIQGPRAYDGTDYPALRRSVDLQRALLSRQGHPNILHDMITVFDHALTRPWTADKTYRLNANPHANWREDYCIDNNVNVVIGKENYWLSADGLLMPTKKNQAAPDLRYFHQSQNR